MLLLTTQANKTIFLTENFKKKFLVFSQVLPYFYIPSLFFNAGLIINDQMAYYGGYYLNYLQFRITLSLLIGILLIVQHYKQSKYAFFLGLVLLGNILTHFDSLFVISLFKAGVFIIKVIALFISLKFYLRPIKSIHILKIRSYLLVGVLLLQGTLALIQYFIQNFIDFLPLYWLGQPKATYLGGYLAYLENIFHWGSNNLILRSYGTLPHPNILAGLSLLALILLYPTRKIWRLGWYLGIIASIIILLTTFSKAALLTGIFLGIIWWSDSLRLKGGQGSNRVYFLLKNKLGLALVGILVNVLIISSTWLFNEWIYFEFSYVRILLNGGAGKIIRLFPIGGVGWYHFVPYLIDHDILANYQAKFIQPVHNILLLLLAELGIFFTLGLIGSLIYLWEKIDFLQIKNSQTSRDLFIWLIILGGLDHYIFTYILG